MPIELVQDHDQVKETRKRAVGVLSEFGGLIYSCSISLYFDFLIGLVSSERAGFTPLLMLVIPYFIYIGVYISTLKSGCGGGYHSNTCYCSNPLPLSALTRLGGYHGFSFICILWSSWVRLFHQSYL